MSELALALKGEVCMKYTKAVRLRSDDADGTGEIELFNIWYDYDPMWRADVLKDWILELTSIYSDTWNQMGREGITLVDFVVVPDDYFD